MKYKCKLKKRQGDGIIMGGKCSPSGGINPSVIGGVGGLDKWGKPNSRTDLYDEHGELIQSRWYDQDGWVMWNRDFKHSDPQNNHEFPHDHSWEWKSKEGHGKANRSLPLKENQTDFC